MIKIEITPYYEHFKTLVTAHCICILKEY